MNIFNSFKEVWLCDFEFGSSPGDRPEVRCLVAKEYLSGRLLRLWADALGSTPPFDVGSDSLFVAYYACAELGCFLSLGWPIPIRILDLFTEFRNLTNGSFPLAGNSLLGALSYFGLDGIRAGEKAEMRALALRGGRYTAEEKAALLDYCQGDVEALSRLLPRILPRIEYLPRSVYRGRYMAAVARMEHEGVPMDMELLVKLRNNWEAIQGKLIVQVDKEYGVFDGRTFKIERFEAYLVKNGMPWPRLESGQLDLSNDTFKDMALAYPNMANLRDLRHSLSQMRLSDLQVGADGCNRCLLSPFSSRTSRNQPSNSKFVFGASSWLRRLIQPKLGSALAALDWVQQEFGIAASLSGDRNMLDAYNSGDSYLAFAKQAKAVPEDATKKSHRKERDLFKACVLGVQYGMEAESLALRINRPVIVARNLLRLHREVYSQFWKWSDNTVDHTILTGQQATVFSWVHRIPEGYSVSRNNLRGDGPNPRMLRNFYMQANGAEILRLACILATEAGIRVCAPIHDAVLITAPEREIEEAATAMSGYMREASRIVLNGFELRTDLSIVRYPDHYSCEKGAKFWNTVSKLLEGLA
jgi:DNA polymerase family A